MVGRSSSPPPPPPPHRRAPPPPPPPPPPNPPPLPLTPSSSVASPRLTSPPASAKTRYAKNLLDVDALKSASEFYTKPRNDSKLFWRGLLRLLLFPAYPKWWAPRLGGRRFWCYVALAAAYLGALAMHFLSWRASFAPSTYTLSSSSSYSTTACLSCGEQSAEVSATLHAPEPSFPASTPSHPSTTSSSFINSRSPCPCPCPTHPRPPSVASLDA